MRKARKANTPHRAPAFPATVKARITGVSGAHFARKIARNNARSASRILDTRFFRADPCQMLDRDKPRYFRLGFVEWQSTEGRGATLCIFPLTAFRGVTGEGGFSPGLGSR